MDFKQFGLVKVYTTIGYAPNRPSKVEVNWSATGSVDIATARKFHKDFADALEYAAQEEERLAKEESEDIPFIAIGQYELDKAPLLTSDTVHCKQCGGEHPIIYGKEKQGDGSYEKSKMLASYICGGKAYLYAINGKIIERR